MNLKSYALKRLSENHGTDKNIAKNIAKFLESTDRIEAAKVSRPIEFKSKIEVLIPCYNQGEFLEEAVNSLVNQTSKVPLYITLINDGSTDNTAQYMKIIQATFNSSQFDIKIITNEKNLLQAGSLNKAISESKNELFIVLNSDDLLTKDCLDLIIETYTQNDDIFLLGGSSIWFESGQELPYHKPKKISNLKLKKFGPRDVNGFSHTNSINITHSSSSFYKSAWRLVGGYLPLEERVCSHDDRDFQMRVCSLLPIGIYQDYPMAYYRTDSSLGRGNI